VAAVFSEKLPNRINAVLRVKVQPHFVFVPVVPGDPDAQRAVRLQTASPRAVLPTWPERPVVPELELQLPPQAFHRSLQHPVLSPLQAQVQARVTALQQLLQRQRSPAHTRNHPRQLEKDPIDRKSVV